MAGSPERLTPPDAAAPADLPRYAELHCVSNFSFLRGASHPEELITRAIDLGYTALALTDECSVAGVVRAWTASKGTSFKLIVGSEFRLHDAALTLILLARNRQGYGQLCQLITLARRRSDKGEYALGLSDVINPATLLDDCLCLWRPEGDDDHDAAVGRRLRQHFPERLWLLGERLLDAGEAERLAHLRQLADTLSLPITAASDVHLHEKQRQPLQDLLSAIRNGTTVQQAGHVLHSNSERVLRERAVLAKVYPAAWLAESIRIAERCQFDLSELRYEYPPDVVPPEHSAASWLCRLVQQGETRRFPQGTPAKVSQQIAHELTLIADMRYEHYFLTIYDIVHFAKQRGILCQGRGSAANSVVCYCLGITEVDPTRVNLLFERFISKERNEPPDIDVDFEHERREEVIQYIYRRYGRERAALAATVICYRPRSALRDAGKALGLDADVVEHLVRRIDWRNAITPWQQQLAHGLPPSHGHLSQHFLSLVDTLIGFPRHLSQHVGGFVIAAGPLSQLVPIENAAMADRTVIQWDKDDLEALGLMKVDILALGMLTAIRKSLRLISDWTGQALTLSDIPPEDPAVYAMLQTGDSTGVFQVESRAQMNMLPRLKPSCYYDLVIEVAIVRPGPIQGDMVHPYLRRRQGLEAVDYPNDAVRQVLEPTLGVPIFQEQVIRLAMVAAGFSAGEADQLRRAMANWKRNGKFSPFRDKLIHGMRERGHSTEFAERVYKQISGFGEYGFPESHAASFALLVYVSAWLKRHHPAAFCCGLLNSQPMGFYSASQLVQDARQHGVTVLPPDVQHSAWDHQLERVSGRVSPALRLGLRLIRGLHRHAAETLVQARPPQGFSSLAALSLCLRAADLETLASAGALGALSPHRYQARWDILGLTPPSPLFMATKNSGDTPSTPTTPDEGPSTMPLPQPSEGQDLLEDYHALSLTLGRHPLALLRHHPRLKGCLTAAALALIPHKRLVKVAGLVTGRQRPGAAGGVTFVTLEDETGNINVVVWKATAHAQRQALLSSRLLMVQGIVEREGSIIHVIAGKLTEFNALIGELDVPSRNFR